MHMISTRVLWFISGIWIQKSFYLVQNTYGKIKFYFYETLQFVKTFVSVLLSHVELWISIKNRLSLRFKVSLVSSAGKFLVGIFRGRKAMISFKE